VGSWLEVRTGDAILLREIAVGGGHGGGQAGWIHVGLGPSDAAEVRVTWPDGTSGPWMRVAANEFVEIERGAGEPQPWQPPGG
jgi:hypothetical protein